MSLKKAIYTFNGCKYEVWSNGDIYGRDGKLKVRPNGDGYASVTLGSRHIGRRRVCVHRIVAELFLENPLNLPEIDHKDGNRMNPALENLERVTHQENIRRAKAKGSYQGRYVGEKNPRAVLSENIVRVLRMEHENGAEIKEIAKRYGRSESTLRKAIKRETWKHVV